MQATEVEIRKMLPEEKEEVVALAKTLGKFVKDLGAIWTRWQMWEKSPPFVAIKGGKIVGFNAVTFLKKDYVYTIYIGVSPECRGLGIAKNLMWSSIEEGKKLGLTRYSALADIKGDGYTFYSGFGMKPVARRKTENMFDCEFTGAASVQEFRQLLKEGKGHTPPSASRHKLYTNKYEEVFYTSE